MGSADARLAQDVAIVGMSCRFADEANSVENFWDFICKGRSAYSENPDRWNVDAYHYPEKKANTSITRGAHFLKQDISAFDANFFNISKTDAESIDPQQRMVMELTFEAVENAGLAIHKLAGTKTGMFVASFSSDYREMLHRDAEAAPMYAMSGTSNTSTSNRVSWFFDFKGPSFTLNTACSSSLVATHLACQSLWLGESSTAIVGGTSLLLNPDLFMFLSNQGFLAPDGKSKAFDATGDGYGRGEGTATLVLKRVEDAVRDGDPIRAVIRGSAVNQDGHTKGLTLPSADAQEQLIQDAYRTAGLGMEDTRYVEAHGTGTKAGDTQETDALSRTISKHRSSKDPLLIGSVKTNVGHLEACAGLASLIKCAYILETGMIPPTPSYKNGNPGVKWNEWHLKVPTSLVKFPTNGLRRVSTQGFGYGGTNAHIILDDAYNYLKMKGLTGVHYTKLLSGPSATAGKKPTNAKHSRVFPISAQDKEGLKRVRTSLAQHLKLKAKEIQKARGSWDAYLADVAFTLSERRSRLQWQTYTVADSIDKLASALEEENPNPEVRGSTQAPRLGFIFTGQGAQWPEMGKDLMEFEVFRKSVEESDRYFREGLGSSWSAIEELNRPEDSSRLGEATFSQPLCSVIQIALVDLLETWNVTPAAVAGHSSGEMAAAYCLGALEKNDALKAAYYRGVLSAEMKDIDPSLKGGMMAVGSSPEEAEKWIDKLTKGDVVVACVNSPTSVTCSGDIEGINELEGLLKEGGVLARKLKVDTAYHSPHMQTIAAEYFEHLADMATYPAKEGRRMHSSVIGTQINADELGAGNWVRNLTSPVQFADAVHDMIRPEIDGKRATENAIDLFVEIGPHSALQGPVSQTMKNYNISGIEYRSVLSRNKNAVLTALSCAGALFNAGVPINMQVANRDVDLAVKPLVDLPSYPWNHSMKFWAETRMSKEYRQRKHPRLPLLGAPYPSVGVQERHWRGFIRTSEEPWVSDHVIQDSVLYPAAGYLAMAIEAAFQEADEGKTISAIRLRDIKIDSALVIEEDVEPEVILELRPHLTGTVDTNATWTEFTVSSCTDKTDLRQNCFGLLLLEYEADEGSQMSSERASEANEIKLAFQQTGKECQTPVNVKDFYEHLSNMGLTYGPTFSNVIEINNTNGKCVSSLKIPELETMVPPAYRKRSHIIHPSVLDAIFHLAFAAIRHSPNDLKGAMVPTSIEEVVVAADIPYKPGEILRGVGQTATFGLRDMKSDIHMLDEQGNKPVVHIKGFRCADVSGGNSSGSENNVPKAITFQPAWKPAIDLLTLEELQTVIAAATTPSPSEQKTKLNLAAVKDSSALAFIEQALSEINKQDVVPDQQQLYSYLTNLRSSVNIEAQFEKNGGDEAFKQLAESLPKILKGEASAEGDLAQLLRDTVGFSEITSKLGEYLSLLHHSNPALSILEVGLGFEKRPVSVFAQLKNAAELLETVKFTLSVTDDAAAAKAGEQLGALKEQVTIKPGDFGKTIKADETKYDVVIIFDNQLASKGSEALIKSAKSALNENGKIIVLGTTQPEVRLGTILGAYGQVGQKGSSWESGIQSAGLTPQLAFKDPQFGVVMAGSSAPASKASSDEITLIEAAKPTANAQRLASDLATALQKLSIKVSRVQWNQTASQFHGKDCIVLTDLEGTLLKGSGDDFSATQELVLNAGSLLWVSGDIGPDAGMAAGLARSIRNEVPGINIKTLEIKGTPLTSSHEFSDLVVRVLQTSSRDEEYVAKNGILHVSRLVEDRHRNEGLATLLGERDGQTTMMPLGKVTGPVKLCVQNPGMLDSLAYEPDYIPETPIPAGHVEVDIKASGINFRDVMVALGQIPDSLLGFEAAGYVRKVGPGVTNHKVGDRVCFICHGAHRTVHRPRAIHALKMPESMSFEEAAGQLIVQSTAWVGLMKTARAQKGQSILIHAASGGVGQSAIMLANHIGMEIYATVGSQDKKELIMERYGIKEDHIFNSRDLSFVKGVKRMTKGRGVDVVLNSLSGETLRQSWHCIAPFGTFVEVGIKDIIGNTRLDMKPFLQDATFGFININHIERERPEVLAEALQGVMDLLSAGITKPIAPLTVYPVSQIEAAFRIMQQGKHRGKLVLTYSPEDVVPVLRTSADRLQLKADSSYFLVGGLGGLGRSLSQFFVSRGAKKLSFLSRSGAQAEHAQKLVRELEADGIDVKVCRGDVADPQVVANAIKDVKAAHGSIAGVVQCAMLLRDGLFEKMDYKSWTESTRPKVQGTWNLHDNLPDVDFFITLSSFAGVFGSRGQSNYSSAGAYEDALAHYRRSIGQKAITLDLGIMRDVGVLAEKGITDYLREWEEPFGIREPEFHALMESTIASEVLATDPKSVPAQIPTGFATGRTAAEAGISTPFYFEDPRFSILAQTGGQSRGVDGTEKAASVQSQLSAAKSMPEAASAVTSALVTRVAKSLQSAVSDIDTSRPLHSFGVDSLVAVEVNNWVFKEIKAKMTVFDILSTIPITALAEKIASKSSLLTIN